MNKTKNSKPPVAKNKKPKRRKKATKIVQIIGMNMDEIYAIINVTQVKRMSQTLVVDPNLEPMILNILKDCQITFTKELKSGTKHQELHIHLEPPPEKKISDELFEFTDDMPDEISDEEDSIFGAK